MGLASLVKALSKTAGLDAGELEVSHLKCRAGLRSLRLRQTIYRSLMRRRRCEDAWGSSCDRFALELRTAASLSSSTAVGVDRFRQLCKDFFFASFACEMAG
eukprot:1242838-Pleurochrysis_carterae.AAC.1